MAVLQGFQKACLIMLEVFILTLFFTGLIAAALVVAAVVYIFRFFD